MTPEENQVLKEIGAKLIALRKQKGYSSHESFALDHDLPRVQYWRVEAGKANCTIKTLARILSIHQLSVTEFFSIKINEVDLKAKPARMP